MYLLELENRNIKMYHSDKQVIINHLNLIKKHRNQLISDAEKINDLFGHPLEKEWDAFGASLVDCTPENGDEYTARRVEIENKEKELFGLLTTEWILKNKPEWHDFFSEHSGFSDIDEELRFIVSEIKEFPNVTGDFSIFDFSPVEIETIIMYGRSSGED